MRERRAIKQARSDRLSGDRPGEGAEWLDRLLLLGATSASINHIATIDDAAEIDLILQAVGRGQSPFKTFGKFFGRSSDDKRSPAAQDGSNEVQEQ